jgi:hypothetical protein
MALAGAAVVGAAAGAFVGAGAVVGTAVAAGAQAANSMAATMIIDRTVNIFRDLCDISLLLNEYGSEKAGLLDIKLCSKK